MKRLISQIWFVMILLLSCNKSHDETITRVYHAGALKNFMHKGDLSAKFDLKDLNDSAHVYALGALENLKGEILIWDNEPFISMEKDSTVFIEHTLDHKAALVVYAVVDEWHEIIVPDSIAEYPQLENFVLHAAISKGIDTSEAFPFLLIGKASSVDWHVINWPEGDTKHTHYKHQTSGPHGKLEDQEVDILGFYSNHHHAIFTHHSTNMHLHVKTKDGLLAGHVDDLTLGQNMTLYLPN